jgi:methylmalonyl-CoA/ethylmalonyl-CoA epimerase
MLTEIDHVAAIDYYQRAYGVDLEHRERVERDGVDEALLKVADSYVQLLRPFRDDSTVAKFLERKGEGIHHVGYRVDSCAEAVERLKAEGYQLIDQEPRPGSRGTTVAFVHPKGAFGTLIELVEEPE